MFETIGLNKDEDGPGSMLHRHPINAIAKEDDDEERKTQHVTGGSSMRVTEVS